MKTLWIFGLILIITLFQSALAQDLLAYDDDKPDQRIGGMDQYLGVRMSPIEEGEILELHFDLSLAGESGQFEVLLFDWVGSSPSSTPVYQFVASVHESGRFIHKVDPPIPYSGEFIVGFRSLESGLKLGADPANNDRCWIRSVGEPGWKQSDQSFFIRAMVRTSSGRKKTDKDSKYKMPNPSDDIIVIGTDGTISRIVFLDSAGNLALEQDLTSGERMEVTKLVPGPYLLLLYSKDELVSTERVFIR